MKKHSKKIIYVAKSPQAYPASGGRTRIISVAKLHRQFDFDTSIVCLVPLRFFLLRPAYLMDARRRLALESNSRVIYVPEMPSFGKRLGLRIQEFISTRFLSLYSRRFYMLHGHGIAASWICLVAKHLRRNAIKVTSDIHGASAEEAMYSQNLNEQDQLIVWLHKKERFVYEHSDLCIFVSQRMVQHIQQKFGVLPQKYLVIPCATEMVHEPMARNDLRKTLNIENKLAFVYLGSFRKYQMVEETIRLFAQISGHFEEAILIVFTSHLKEFENELKKHNIDSGKYLLKKLEREEVPRYLSAMDIGLMLREDEVLNKVASPTKFAEYLISGLPVITTPYVGDYSEMVMKYGLGYTIEEIELSASLMAFINNVRNHRMEVFQRCQEFAKEHLTWEGLASEYQQAVNALIDA